MNSSEKRIEIKALCWWVSNIIATFLLYLILHFSKFRIYLCGWSGLSNVKEATLYHVGHFPLRDVSGGYYTSSAFIAKIHISNRFFHHISIYILQKRFIPWTCLMLDTIFFFSCSSVNLSPLVHLILLSPSSLIWNHSKRYTEVCCYFFDWCIRIIFLS